MKTLVLLGALAVATPLAATRAQEPGTPPPPPIPVSEDALHRMAEVAMAKAQQADDQAPPVGPVSVTQAQLDKMIAAAMARGAQARAPQAPSPSNPYDPQPGPGPGPSPQGAPQAVQAAPQQYVAAQTQTVQSIAVLVPPGPVAGFFGKCGQKIAALATPRTRTMQIAPVTQMVTPTVSYVTTVPQQQAPVQVVQAVPQAAPVKQAPVASSQDGSTPFTFVKPSLFGRRQ